MSKEGTKKDIASAMPFSRAFCQPWVNQTSSSLIEGVQVTSRICRKSGTISYKTRLVSIDNSGQKVASITKGASQLSEPTLNKVYFPYYLNVEAVNEVKTLFDKALQSIDVLCFSG